MAERPSKRVRTSTNSESVNTDRARLAKLPGLIHSLSEKKIREFLLIAAKEYPRIATMLESEIERLKKIESSKTIDFGYHSKSVWRTLNVDYVKGIKSSRQFELSGEAFDSVSSSIEDIRNRCPVHASYVTKYSALETLRKIRKIIILSSDDTLGNEVQNRFCSDTVLEDTMWGIVTGMTEEEREDMMQEPQEEMIWIDKLKELHEMGVEYCMFDGLAMVISLLEGGDDSASDNEEDEGVEIVDLTDDVEDKE